jgi:nucleoside-diphosphate-sugar epimerase
MLATEAIRPSDRVTASGTLPPLLQDRGWDDPHLRKWNLWGYVDESHVAQGVRCALDADIEGAESFIIAAADTVMMRPSRELMAEVFPGVPLAEQVDGHDTLLDITKARTVLGYSPEFSWRALF